MGVDLTVISRPDPRPRPRLRRARPRGAAARSLSALLLGAGALACQGCAGGAERRPEEGPDRVLPAVLGGFGVALGVLGGLLVAEVPAREAEVDRLRASGAAQDDVQRAEIEVTRAQAYGAMGIICGGLLAGLALTFWLVEPPPEAPPSPPDAFGPPQPAGARGQAPASGVRNAGARPARTGASARAQPAAWIEAGPTGFTLRF